MSSTTACILRLYQQVAPPDYFVQLRQQYELPSSGIYQPSLVMWLMMLQRLDAKGTLFSAVQQVVRGEVAPLLPSHKRIRDSTVSICTGAYSRARKGLPVEAVEQVAERIFVELMKRQQPVEPGFPGEIFLLDGSSLATPATPVLRESFPTASNQHGQSHWPTIRIVVAHDLATGLAVRPEWGPMYGAKACSEQALAEKVMDRLPPHSALVADRNFGVFSIAWAAQQKRQAVVVRLTESRARKIAGLSSVATFGAGFERVVDWKPSRDDRRTNPGLTAEAMVTGRMIVAKLERGKKIIQLYLFTTMELSADQIVALYGRRWNIETDLRSLKQTVRLHQLTSKSTTMISKELLTAVAAYNMIRGIQAAAARRVGIDARDLSYSQIHDLVNGWLPILASITDEQKYEEEFERMMRYAARCRLPKRTNRPAYPREVWGRNQSFPKRKEKA